MVDVLSQNEIDALLASLFREMDAEELKKRKRKRKFVLMILRGHSGFPRIIFGA